VCFVLQILRIKVKDWDATGKNDLQGVTEIVVNKLEPEKKLDIW
jgi:Ca2+-dependent lipid-binding protein